MKQFVSTTVDLPVIYMVSNEEDLEKLPLGIPYIYGEEDQYDKVLQYLEWTILLRSAEATGLPFDWKSELSRLGYKDASLSSSPLAFSGDCGDRGKVKFSTEGEFKLNMEDYLKDGWFVSYDVLTSLKVIPTWLADLEESIRVNVLNSVTYNPTLFNKKLGGFYGASEMTASKRNLGILDFSGSIPTSVVVTTAMLAKTLSRTFFCDILITGSYSKLFKYEELEGIDLMKEAEAIGRDNDQLEFVKLLSEDREYNTVFSFGDDDYPGHTWNNSFNSGTRKISEEEGKKLCQWKVEKVISLHTKQNGSETGYTRWFTPTEGVQHVTDWVRTLKR